jgi:hypothetical protein
MKEALEAKRRHAALRGGEQQGGTQQGQQERPTI